MSNDNNINNNEDHDKIKRDNAIQFLNSIADSHSIKDQLLKKSYYVNSLESVHMAKNKQDDREDNSDGTYKIINFL